MKSSGEMISKHEMYRAEIREWVLKHTHDPVVLRHPNWDKNIFSWKHDQIVEYILTRLNTTRDEGEYYHCMIFLVGAVDDYILFHPFPIWKFLDDGTGDYSLCQYSTRGVKFGVEIKRDALSSDEFNVGHIPSLEV